jgi:hypothetical protein
VRHPYLVLWQASDHDSCETFIRYLVVLICMSGKEYSEPKIKEYGCVSELTMGNQGSGGDALSPTNS